MAEDPEMELPETPQNRGRRRKLARMSGGGAAILALALGGLWSARKPIADHFIAQTLRESGVPGSYLISRIGPRTQRLDNLVLGDPANPDLTARWVEVDLGYAFSGVRVTGLRAEGVRVSARYANGALDLGSISKLMGEGGGAAELPDIVARLKDVRGRLATDGGDIGFSIEGSGNLRSGFAGRVGVAAPRLTLGGCALDRLEADTALTSQSGELQIKGPVKAGDIGCQDAGFALRAPVIQADVRSDSALSKITAALALSAADARQGERLASRLSGLVTFKGSIDQLEGSAALAAERTALGFAMTGPLKLGGQFAARPRARDQAYSYAGTLTAEDLRPQSDAALAQIAAQAAGTPLDPLARKLADALRAATRANRLTASGRLSGAGEQMQLLVNSADFAAASGARVALDEGSRFTLQLPQGTWALQGGLHSRGGGLPETRLTLASRPDGALAGEFTLADYRAGTARLGLTPVRFSRSPRGDIRVATTVSLDGPIGDGAVRGLQAPVDALVTSAGSLRLVRDCMPVRWQALRISTAAIDPGRIDLCGLNGSTVRIGALALQGSLGDNPLSLKVKDARYALQSGRFDVTGVDGQIGSGEDPIIFQAALIDGSMGKDGSFGGSLTQGRAIIGPVPLEQSDIAGTWRFANGALAFDGAARVTDRQAEARFMPLSLERTHLSFADGRIDVRGAVVHPIRKAQLANVTISHMLGSGEGRADFTVDDLTFGQAIQPDDITPMALGVIANVEGAVQGKGAIRWSSAGVVSSDGIFSTQDMNFAAAFGPVTGFATTINFTDLLAMRTAPHQRLTMKQVSSGVDVFDGVIDYALLSNEQARIEGGHWPFSGGVLELLPATLELDARRARHFIFRVTGLDAGAFIQTMEIANISATGTFDGVFPMIFDERGGRIEGGVLVARQGGFSPLVLTGSADSLPLCDTNRQAGMLSYVGPVSDAQMGAMGKMAFDVLKNLGYKCLTVHLDGALDGEFVTKVHVNGVNLGTDEARGSMLARPLIGLPFIFNVNIEAPFKQVFGAFSAISDPTPFIREELKRRNAPANQTPLAVQPVESEKGPEEEL